MNSYPDYAVRLSGAIDKSNPFVLVGLSLGGIMAVEIAKGFRPALTIIICFAPLSSQLPFYYRLAGKVNLLWVIPPTFFKVIATLKRLVTRETVEDTKDLLKMI